jgi:hypothetical protein
MTFFYSVLNPLRSSFTSKVTSKGSYSFFDFLSFFRLDFI